MSATRLMAIYDTICTVTGLPGGFDDCWGSGCLCTSPMIGLKCDGSFKTAEEQAALMEKYRRDREEGRIVYETVADHVARIESPEGCQCERCRVASPL